MEDSLHHRSIVTRGGKVKSGVVMSLGKVSRMFGCSACAMLAS